MKISKFNVNSISKFRKSKLMKGVAALGLTSIVATTFASCGEKETLFQGTILENAVVASVDGDTEILRNEHVSDSYDDHVYIKNGKEEKILHDHYINIVTGEWIANGENVCYVFRNQGKKVHPRNAQVTDIKSIDNYLTKEEFEKAQSGNFTDSDAITVITRIKSLDSEKNNSKVK